MKARCPRVSSLGVPAALLAFTFLLAFALAGNAQAQASAAPILVEASQGDVRYRPDANTAWISAITGASLAVPGEIKTGPNASATLSQAGSTFTAKADTHLAFEADGADGKGLLSKVKHWLGTVFYSIERQPDEFTVETPFLVSTVKGTEFVIVSTATASFITLNEGLLEVADLDTGAVQMMRPGDISGSSSGFDQTRSFRSRPETQASGGMPTDSAIGPDELEDTPASMDAMTEIAVEQQVAQEMEMPEEGADDGPAVIDEPIAEEPIVEDDGPLDPNLDDQPNLPDQDSEDDDVNNPPLDAGDDDHGHGPVHGHDGHDHDNDGDGDDGEED